MGDRLGVQDLHRGFGLLEDCHGARGSEEFREVVLDALGRRLGLSTVMFWIADRGRGPLRIRAASWRGVRSRDVQGYRAGHHRHDPFADRAVLARLEQVPVLTLAQVAGGARDHQRQYLQGFFGRRGYVDQATTCLPTGLDRHGYLTVVTEQEDVSPRTVALLALLRPHLAAALRAHLLVPGPAPTAGLTPREDEVARLVASGLPNARVAAALGITEETVKKHLTRVFTKTGCRSRTELAVALGADGAPRAGDVG